MSYPKRVLLIDDDEDDCFIFNSAVQELGSRIELLYETDSEKAIDHLFSEQIPAPDLLFLDWNMHKKTGKDCLMEIRRHPRFANLPIIIFTNSTAEEDLEEAMRLGASHFVSKPTSFPELVMLLGYIFSVQFN